MAQTFSTKLSLFSNLEQCIIQIFRFDRLREATNLLLNNLAEYMFS